MGYSTFSIVAYDPDAQAWGVATQSKFLAVGAVVPWARAGVGALATQAHANTSFGPRGLERMASGLSAQETLDRLVAEDEGRAHRQAGLVDARGNAATFTGKECYAWAGGRTGKNYAVQGNILVSEETIIRMAETFETSTGELAERLVATLAAGQRAGGDKRGQQSAALLVVREKGGYAGLNDRYIDLRVDDDPRPIDRLREILALHYLYFKRPDPDALIPIDRSVARELQRIARQGRQYAGPVDGEYDADTRKAVEALIGMENLEERWQADSRIDPAVLAFLQRAYPPEERRLARTKAQAARKSPARTKAQATRKTTRKQTARRR
ncbi:MAG TPA: DUF1028 domain-containing protein [Anaerolineae bacterium]|nr:DUF1028 domain-containing protein [Anaerolineae bacterium]